MLESKDLSVNEASLTGETYPADKMSGVLAEAVGLTPQLLPAIVSVNLARGAKQMAKKQVIVKRLAAIEN